jgi:hypothetical protein
LHGEGWQVRGQDPPLLAWRTEDGWFGCPIDPDRPWAAASDQEMLELRRHAGDLVAIGG